MNGFCTNCNCSEPAPIEKCVDCGGALCLFCAGASAHICDRCKWRYLPGGDRYPVPERIQQAVAREISNLTL